MRGLLLLVLLLEWRRQPILQVPRLVRERGMLRHQQQSCQKYLQQAAFQGHGVLGSPAVEREQINTRMAGRQKARKA